MLLAGDLGGTKTVVGLFERGSERPEPVAAEEYRTLDFANLTELARQFLSDVGANASLIQAAAFGVAGPIVNDRAALTNVPWIVAADALRAGLGVPAAYLINDLEALAWSIAVLRPEEVMVLQAGDRDPRGNAALMAAGTGLGVALLPNIGGRLVPRASEGGHTDFAPRNDEEVKLMYGLTSEYGRAEIERVVSGPGIANIHRILYPHECATVMATTRTDDLPAAISRGALGEHCASCTKTLECFVSAYGAAAGNLAVTALATGGIYLGGGIAPRILPALEWPLFMRAFLDKAPMDELVSRIPVSVILNPRAGLLGAATYASTRQ